MFWAAIIVVPIGALLLFARTKPDVFTIERSTDVRAPPDKIFPFIQDFRRWSVWSPWEKLDPALKRTFSGAEQGTGARYAWEGNRKAGMGTMEIIETSPPNKVTIKLDFLKPFEGHTVAEFTMQPQGELTHVTWSMRGPSAYVSKLMSVFVDMDNMLGKDFAAGLANLKAAAEGGG